MHVQWESLANEHILGIEPYEPGKPLEELERELGIHDAIKLASNENPLPPSAARAEGHRGGARPAQPLSRRQRLLSPPGPGQEARRDGGADRARQRLQRADRADRAQLREARRRGGGAASVVRALPDDRAGGRRHPRHGDAQGLSPGPGGHGPGHHPHDQAGLHRQPEQSHRHHRDRRRGGAVHVEGARADHRDVRRGLHRVRARPRLSRRPRLRQAGAQGAWCCGPSPRRPAWPACGSATASPTRTRSPS